MKCVHKLTEAIAQRKSKGLHDAKGNVRYSLDGKQTSNKYASLSSIAEPLLVRRNSTSGIFVSNVQNRPPVVRSTHSLPIYSRFRTQMVVLQRTVPSVLPVSSNAPENQRPHLLEICSNCNWEPIRSQLLGRMSAVCSVMGDFPPQMTFTIEPYFVAVLPKPDKTTPIPPNLQPVLQTQEMFSIRLKITPLGYIDPNQPNSMTELNSTSLSDTSVRKLEQISKAPTLASMLALPTPLYAPSQVDQNLGKSGFKTISLSISGGKIVSSTQTLQQIPREFVSNAELRPNSKMSDKTVSKGPPEPIEIIPISDDSSPDCSPGITKPSGNVDVDKEDVSGQASDQAGDSDTMIFTADLQTVGIDSDSQGEETITVTIDEDVMETGSCQETDVKTDDECTSQEGETVTVTIDEEMVDPSNEADKNTQHDSALSATTNKDSGVSETIASPVVVSTDGSEIDSQPDILLYAGKNRDNQSHDISEMHSRLDTQMDAPGQNVFDNSGINSSSFDTVQNKNDAMVTENVATDEDGSRDSVSISLPDLRPSSSCSNATEQAEHEHQSDETETLDQALLPDLPTEATSHKTKLTSPASCAIPKSSESDTQHKLDGSHSTSPNQVASISISELCTSNEESSTSVIDSLKTVPGAQNSPPNRASEKKSPIISDTLPLRLENGSLKFLPIPGISKASDNVKTNEGGKGTKVGESMSGVLRPVVLKDKQPVISVPRLTLIPVTAVQERVINGNTTTSYKQDKIAVPVSLICTNVGTAKPFASGVRRNSTGAGIPIMSPKLILRSPSADSHSKVSQTLRHFVPVNTAIGTPPSLHSMQSKSLAKGTYGSPSGSCLPMQPTKMAGIDTTREFIPLDQLGALSGLNKLQGSNGSAFRPVSTQGPTGSPKQGTSKNGRGKSARTPTDSLHLKENIGKGETPPNVIHILDDDDAISDNKARLSQVIQVCTRVLWMKLKLRYK